MKKLMLSGFAVVLLAFIVSGAPDDGPKFSPWGEAEIVGEPASYSGSSELCPVIAKNNLDLYFRKLVTGRGYDIFVSHRDSDDSPWEEPISLGDNVNSTTTEACSFVTIDGHWIYFVSSRTDLLNYGSTDIYVSHRQDKRDDDGWETPKNLGPLVNTSGSEVGPAIFEDEATGQVVLYFNRWVKIGESQGKPVYGYKIYIIQMIDKETPGPDPAILDDQLNLPGASDYHPFVRQRDGLEVVFCSNRPGSTGTLGYSDLYVATRPTTSTPWSTPENLGPNVNSDRSENRPSISWDGTSLYFWSDRERIEKDGKVYWYADVYQATRTKITGTNK